MKSSKHNNKNNGYDDIPENEQKRGGVSKDVSQGQGVLPSGDAPSHSSQREGRSKGARPFYRQRQARPEGAQPSSYHSKGNWHKSEHQQGQGSRRPTTALSGNSTPQSQNQPRQVRPRTAHASSYPQGARHKNGSWYGNGHQQGQRNHQPKIAWSEEPKQVSQPQKQSNQKEIETIDVSEDKKVTVDIIDIYGDKVGEREIVNPIFNKIVGDNQSFVIVELPGDTVSERDIQRSITYKNKTYHINMSGGSSVKSSDKEDIPGKLYGIEKEAIDVLKNMFGFEESAYYMHRALFPTTEAGVSGTIKGRAIPLEKDVKNTFKLRDKDTVIQVDDGWGYIKESLAEKIQKDNKQLSKRQRKENSAHISYQMLQWFDDEDPGVINELTQKGINEWKRLQENDRSYLLAERGQYLSAYPMKSLQSILTAGHPSAEIGVAMPVSGKNVVIPSKKDTEGKDSSRYAKHLPGDISVIRSPADKQNFRPVEQSNVDNTSELSELIGGMEGLQYTWTGRQQQGKKDGDGLLTFFKGMLGVIEDKSWPEEWNGVDVVVCSKDRKLFEKWERDSSLEKNPSENTNIETDRAAMSKVQQDFSITGSLVATQWYDKGNFVGVPSHIQKWLGGDYDGDEIAMIFGNNNPELQRYIQEKAFKEEQINPKLTKTFKHNPGGNHAHRIMAMRSSNVGIWSTIAARVRSLHPSFRSKMAEATKNGRLWRDEELEGISEETKMEKEIQLGIKVGTDGYKTHVNVSDFEKRAKTYKKELNKLSKPILHDKKIIDILQKIQDETGTKEPTLERPEWRNLFFTYDEKIGKDSSEYAMRGVSPRVLRNIIWALLPEKEKTDDKIADFKKKWQRDPKEKPRSKTAKNKQGHNRKILEPEEGYKAYGKHGIKQLNKNAIVAAKESGQPIGRWGNENDLKHAGRKAATLPRGVMKDFEINPDHECIVFKPDGTTLIPDKIRVRKNYNGTFHGFPIHSVTAAPLRKKKKKSDT